MGCIKKYCLCRDYNKSSLINSYANLLNVEKGRQAKRDKLIDYVNKLDIICLEGGRLNSGCISALNEKFI